MTAPNRAALWGETIVDELAAAGVRVACVSPGSRSTPLTVALADHPEVETFSVLDERSAAFFALGRGRRTGRPTALICTSGTAAANYHPAVVEASQSRVPMVVLTADRPAELHDSGANQTIDQADLYGDAVRYARTLPEPAPEPRRLRSLRVTVDRAVVNATGADPGPVHLNVPVAKPLEPTVREGDVPQSLADEASLAVEGRDGPFVDATAGVPTVDEGTLADLAADLSGKRGLLVAGPTNPTRIDRAAVTAFLDATGVPLLADPLSGLRFGPHVGDHLVCGGYDAYVGAADWPDPDVVVRVGASPTSKPLRQYLRDADARQVVVDPAGDWPEAEFTATDYLAAAPSSVLRGLADHLGSLGATDWRDRFRVGERTHWDLASGAHDEQFFEGSVLATALSAAPDPATVFVSNSMPVRDCDRFARPREADLTVLGNRGASGIDGILSSGLGAGSATDDPLVVVTGDLAFYHDMNGLLSVGRCGVDATVVLVNNDGGGIFHKLPIESFDPPFTDQFKTPHGLDFSPTGDLYGLDYARVDDPSAFETRYRESLGSDGTQVLEVTVDAERSHRLRDQLEDRLRDRLAQRAD
ncbi:2-succinyl-5-enolpyruvyl-6-hydroxy-3-cyclohexene-1-carboxylic-acid synthase [Halobacteriales archaeon QH_10_67_22]|nr:MAG: 2-succinyl-5-enolpyruvyl-6-hydroxy-3-cyclohexene-1-carboxylic-acid synthase [Halobacteriales archaeon QH_10_67_22]